MCLCVCVCSFNDNAYVSTVAANDSLTVTDNQAFVDSSIVGSLKINSTLMDYLEVSRWNRILLPYIGRRKTLLVMALGYSK